MNEMGKIMSLSSEKNKIAQWMEKEEKEMIKLVESWASINSFSSNPQGCQMQTELLKKAFTQLKPDTVKEFSSGLLFSKRSNAKRIFYLGGHYDTVYPQNHPFQTCDYLSEGQLRGPGVADMKGGLVVLLKALQVFEMTSFAESVGWHIFLNNDEEIGSPNSTPLIKDIAKKCQFGLIFEPCLPDGSIVSARRGSTNYLLKAKGKAAHVGRDFFKGINAVVALVDCIHHFTKQIPPHAIVNIASFEGGGPLNIVPDQAQAKINIRAETEQELTALENELKNWAKKHSVEIQRLSSRPPKPLTETTKQMLCLLKECGDDLGQTINWKSTGGVCDGNTLGEMGIPTIDTLGVRGDGLHTPHEFIEIKSLVEKATLTAYFLMKIAAT